MNGMISVMTSVFPIVFEGHVIPGRKRGRDLGSPTINLEPADVPDTLQHGVYACIVGIDPRLPAVMHYGPRPSFHDTLSCEVHVLDTVLGDPPEKMQVRAIEYLREVRAFESTDALKEQIAKDITTAKDILSRHDVI